MSLPSEGQNLSTNQISSRSIYGWDITRSGLEKQTSAILEFYFWFRSRPFPCNLHFILHQPDEFRLNWCSHCGNITSYRFIKMAAAQYYFWFRICWYRCLQKVKVYQETEFRRHISIGSWNITTSVFEKQTSAKFRPNLSTHCGNMTSYPFHKMAAATAKQYFRFRIRWCLCLQKAKVSQQTKFRRDILICGWDITTSGFEIQTSAILQFYFRFRSRPFRRNRRVILHPAAEFRPNRNIHCRNMTSYRFSRWRPPAMLYLLWSNGGPPTKCLSWSEFYPQIDCLSD